MTEQRQNEACCEVLGWEWRHKEGWTEAGYIEVRAQAPWGLDWAPLGYLFTQCHYNLHLLRAAVIEAGCWPEFLALLRGEPYNGGAEKISYWSSDVENLMQATPAQQVEAALRVLGKWESADAERN